MSTELLTRAAAARICHVSREAVGKWVRRGKVTVDSHGAIIAAPFLRERAPEILVSRLQDTINALPPAALPAVLLELLGREYLISLGNMARGDQSNKHPERETRMSDAK